MSAPIVPCKHCAAGEHIYDQQCVACNRRMLKRARAVHVRCAEQAATVIAKAAGPDAAAKAFDDTDPEK
jgi:hypothetical protein